MTTRRNILGSGIAIVASSLVGCGGGGTARGDDIRAATNALAKSLTVGYQSFSRGLSGLAATASSDDLGSAQLSAEFEALQSAYPSLLLLASIGLDGVVQAVSTENPIWVQDEPVNDRFDTRSIIEGGKQYLSSVMSGDNYLNVVLVSEPVLNTAGQPIGAICALMRPAVWVESVVKATPIGIDGFLIAGQPDGVLFQAPDESHLYLNVFEAPEFTQFPELQELASKISAEKLGSTDYSYFDADQGKRVTWQLYWNTVSLYGQDWRVIFQA